MRRFGRLAFMLMVLGVTGCDHTTKRLVLDHLAQGQSWEMVSGLLDIRHTLNTDTAFSLLGGMVPLNQRLLLLRVTAWLGVIGVTLLVCARWKRTLGPERLAWALILGGALGNAIDRLIRGHVIDFIDFHFWPVFNVADMAITVGVGLMILVARKQTHTRLFSSHSR
jgi:signal peptidase II